MSEEHNKLEHNKHAEKAIIAFLILGLAIAIFNQFQLYSFKPIENVEAKTVSESSVPTGLSIVQVAVVPKGTPSIYGEELKVKYDDVSASNQQLADQTIDKLGNLDRTINLQGRDLERYVYVVSQISCEYCCGADSIIVRKEDVEEMNQRIDEAIAAGKITKEEAEQYRQTPGNAACGCAHSFAMRGLAKYLITKHGNEYTDNEILEELGKWKTLFFPGQMQQKADVLKERGIELSYINLASNKYRRIEIEQSQGSASNMVGGC